MNLKIFGKNPAGKRLQRILQSSNTLKGRFQNIEPTFQIRDGVSMFTIMREFYSKPKTVRPAGEIPTVKTDLKSLPAETPTLVWFGHSSYLLSRNGFTILVDPVFSGNISPVGSFGKAFAGADAYSVADLPAIDLLILTHDHYDHLDYKTILELKGKVAQVVTALGVGAHLEYWGFPAALITELKLVGKLHAPSQYKTNGYAGTPFLGSGPETGTGPVGFLCAELGRQADFL